MQENVVKKFVEVVKMLEKFPYYVKPSDYLNFANYCFMKRLSYMAPTYETSFYQEAIVKYYCFDEVKEVSEIDAEKARKLVHKMIDCINSLQSEQKKLHFPFYCGVAKYGLLDADLPYTCDALAYVINEGFDMVPKKNHKKYKVEVIKFNYLLKTNSDKDLITSKAIRLSNDYFDMELALNVMRSNLDIYKKEMEELINEITTISDYQQIVC